MKRLFTLFVSLLSLFNSLFSIQEISNVLSESLHDIQSKAEQGDAYYQGVLGVLYRTGEMVPVISKPLAENWTLKSSAQMHPIGFANQGILAMQSNFPSLAKKHFKKAIDNNLKNLANSGDPIANYCMAELFTSLVPKDYQSASMYYKRAIQANHQTSKGLLGAMHLFGIGLEVNRSNGIRLLREAGNNGSPIAAFSMGIAYRQGIGVEVDEQKTIYWMQKSADGGYAQSQFYMGMCYHRGDFVNQDFQKSLTFLRLSAAQNFAEAEKALSNLLDKPEYQQAQQALLKKRDSIPSNSIESANISNVSPPKSLILGDASLARIDFEDEEPVLTFAERLLKEAESGDIEAMKSIASRYSIMDQNYKESAKWYERAAVSGDAIAQRFLGVLFMIGKGVPQDYKIAEKWFNKAIEGGDKLALKKLKLLREVKN